MSQYDLFAEPPKSKLLTGADFDGETYDSMLDKGRLTSQLKRVHACLIEDRWWTLQEISKRTGDPEASVSARVRDMRKEKFGHMNVLARRRKGGAGTWEYRIEKEEEQG